MNSSNIHSTDINNLESFQKDIMAYVSSYIDKYQKEKFFAINKNFYNRMLICFNNVRQTNEKIEYCVKEEENQKEKMSREMSEIFKTHLLNLENCADICISKNFTCIIKCGNEFKTGYNNSMSQVIENYYSNI